MPKMWKFKSQEGVQTDSILAEDLLSISTAVRRLQLGIRWVCGARNSQAQGEEDEKVLKTFAVIVFECPS